MSNREPVEKPKTWRWWEEEDALWTVALVGNARKCIEALMKEEKSIINTIKPWTDKQKRISLNIV